MTHLKKRLCTGTIMALLASLVQPVVASFSGIGDAQYFSTLNASITLSAFVVGCFYTYHPLFVVSSTALKRVLVGLVSAFLIHVLTIASVEINLMLIDQYAYPIWQSLMMISLFTLPNVFVGYLFAAVCALIVPKCCACFCTSHDKS